MPLMHSTCRVLLKNKRLQCMTKTVNLHVRLMQIVFKQVPCRWSSDSKGVTAVCIELKPWNNRVDGLDDKCGAGSMKRPLSPNDDNRSPNQKRSSAGSSSVSHYRVVINSSSILCQEHGELTRLGDVLYSLCDFQTVAATS